MILTVQSTYDHARFPLYALHSRVAIRWWLTHLLNAPEAKGFMDEKLVSGQAGVLVVEGVDFQVLDELAKDLGQFELSPSIAADLYGDAPKVLGHMADLGILRTVDSKPLALPAFVIACLYAIPLYDALSVALAANSGCPLLVADEDLYETLRIIQADRPALRVVWLSEV